MRILLLVPILIFGSISCNSPTEDTNASVEEIDSTNQQKEETGELSVIDDDTQMNFADGMNFINGWIWFKEYIFSENTIELEYMLAIDSDLDAQNVIDLCHEEWVWKIMKATEYEDLKNSEYNGEAVKEFVAEDIIEVDGEEYGSGIFLYFKETTDGLKLVGLLAAG